MGDASRMIEKQLLHQYPNLKADILKVGIDALNTADVGMIQISSFHGLHFFQTGNHIFGIIGSVI